MIIRSVGAGLREYIYFAGYAADNTAFATSPGAYVTPQLGGGIRTYFGKISP